MVLRTKKVIAREGLIFLVIVAIGGLIYWAGFFLHSVIAAGPEDFSTDYAQVSSAIKSIGMFITVAGYPLRLLVLFPLWAIHTLKQREGEM